MKINLLIASVLVCLCFSAYAQADLEAKAAYMLAEQSYGKGEMKDALQYLDEASAKLGGANAKILYLKIMAQRELANKDQKYLAKLDSSITLFQNAPDAKTFNEEKKLEVMMIKLQAKKELEKIPKPAEMKEMAIKGIKAYEDSRPGWTLGTPLETVKASHPEYFSFFNRKENKNAIVTNPMGTSYVNVNAKNGTSVVTFDRGKLIRYQEKYFNFEDDDRDHSKGKAALPAVLEDFKKMFGYIPTPEIKGDKDHYDFRSESYIWKNGNKKVVLTFVTSWIDILKKGTSYCMSEITDNPFY